VRGVVRIGFASAVAALAVGAGSCASDSGKDAPPIALPDRDARADTGNGNGSDGSTSGGDGASIDVQSCTNGVKDGEETDVDCGGIACPACANGKACSLRRDCASLVCLSQTCTGDIGCADGTREGYVGVDFKNIAACSGAWSIAGLIADATKSPACGRAAGNDGPNTSGNGCNVSDLCQVGWHVCATASEVATKSNASGCAPVANVPAFFVTRQSGPGDAKCGAGANDLFGCGGLGATPNIDGSCNPFDRFSNNLCQSLPATFACGADDVNEANNVTKTSSDNGGVLCCRD
jgi:hypothetical protein